MTPPRLAEIECPICHRVHWIIDFDYRGADMVGGVEQTYEERTYPCPHCGNARSGWTIHQQSPPAFLLQPHDSYPMTHEEFDHWVAILRSHFPDHFRLAELGKTFFPRTPEEVAIREEAFARANPVREMRDQDGARRRDPDFQHAREWMDMMKPGDSLFFLRRDGARLEIYEQGDESWRARYVDGSDRTTAEHRTPDAQHVRTAIRNYLQGDVGSHLPQTW
jgi:hypothetical protein